MNDDTTFWKFLEDHVSIKIPIIQRDYAQGRSGKEALRKAFLGDLKFALDSGNCLKLDFVYGVAENGVLNPLDGQQRLTTLWLLHWYIAYKAGKIAAAKESLGKFSYETRQSSSDFCERLSAFDIPQSDRNGIVAHIQNQTWFRSSWNHDSTIQSMFRMLGGSEYGALDGIEGVFNACHDGECIECRLEQCPVSQVKYDSYGEYWNRLTSNECPVVFNYLDIHGIGQTDNLYIKMNARGKPLTSFENFKADLAGYISRKATEKSDKQETWQDLNCPENGFVIKMDTDWMNNIFWKYKSSDSVVDEICFAFINRYFFNAHAIAMNKISDLKMGDDEVFDFLYGRNGKAEAAADDQIAYFEFNSAYAQVLKNEPGLLKRLAATLDNFQGSSAQYEDIFQSPWGDDFRFVPMYDYNSDELHYDFAGNQIRKIVKITQPHRVVFHAVCKFFEQERSDKDVDALKNWMRVVWNIVENANVNTIPGMISCLKLVDELAKYSHTILEWLKNEGTSLRSDFAKNQVAEEIEKARQILSDKTGDWAEKIKDAEKTAFFRGAIRFLYRDGNGEENWNDFGVKFDNAKCFFDKEGVRDEYRTNARLLRAFLAHEPEKAKSGFWFGHGKVFWRDNVLLDASFSQTIDNLLKTDKGTLSTLSAANTEEWIKDENLIADAINGDTPYGTWHILLGWKCSDDKTLTRYTKRVAGDVNFPHQIIPLSGFANGSLQAKRQVCLTKDMIKDSPQRRGSKWLVGWALDVEFCYGRHRFRWLGAPNRDNGEYDICLLEENRKDGSSYATHDKEQSRTGDAQGKYGFNVGDAMTSEAFKNNLDSLIDSYENNQTSGAASSAGSAVAAGIVPLLPCEHP